MKKQPNLLGPKRRLVQCITVSLFFLVPFFQINQKGLFRVDIANLTLDLFWQTYRIEELYLFWLLIVGLIFSFILTTLVLGRVWCGWLCPQTALSDIAAFLKKILHLKASDSAERIKIAALHLSYLFLSLLFGTTFVWYFLPPKIFITDLYNGSLGAWPAGTALVMTVLTYSNFCFVQRLFCKEFCPYGRFQTILVDKGTLTLQAHPEHIGRCIDCGACQRVCPTGIDIRNGFQIECINCAKCLDACRKVMSKKNEDGIIQYTYGPADLGWRSLINKKVLSITAVTFTLLLGFFVLSANRAHSTFKVGRSAYIESRRVNSDQQMTFFEGSIINHSSSEQTYTLSIQALDKTPLELKGTKEVIVLPGEKKDINFSLLSKRDAANKPMKITIKVCTTQQLCVEQKAFIAPLLSAQK